GKMAWLFEPYLQDLYERRQWNEIARFEASSVGARLVAALVLATARTGELVSSAEAALVEKFHADHRKWLVSYLLGSRCDAECRGKLVDVMVSSYGEAQGDYDEALKRLLSQPRGEAAPTLGHLHARLLWCQVDADDMAELRDRVLVPTVAEALTQAQAKGVDKSELSDRAGKSDLPMVEDLVGLVALVPDPTEPKAQAAWSALMQKIAAADRYQRAFAARRASAKRERTNPPPMIKKVSFCNVGGASTTPALDQ